MSSAYVMSTLTFITRILFFLRLDFGPLPFLASVAVQHLPPHTHKHTFHCPLASLVQPLPLQADGFGQDIPPSCLPTGCCLVIWLHTYTLLPLLATFQKTLHGQNPQNTRDNPKQGSSPSSHLISSSLYIRVNANLCTVVLTSV